MIEYEILENGSLDELIEFVNAWIKEGWAPLGGVPITSDAGYFSCAQAMTKIPAK